MVIYYNRKKIKNTVRLLSKSLILSILGMKTALQEVIGSVQNSCCRKTFITYEKCPLELLLEDGTYLIPL